MNKILRYSFVALLAMVFGNVMAGDVTITPGDFTATTTADFSTTKDGITVSVTASTVTADQIRVFKGKTITISSSVGNITKAVFTCTAEGTDKYGPGCFEDATAGSYSYDGNTGTWIGDAAEFALTAKTNQVRVTSIVVTVGGAVDTRKATTIEFADGYKTKIAGGPDNMFPQVGTFVTLPQATVMSEGAAVAGAEVAWSLEVKKWKESKPQPTIEDGKIVVGDGVNGEITVKASYEGNTSYLGSTKTYTLKVYNSYGLLSEMVNDIADPEFAKNDENDGDGQQVFYFFRNIDAEGFPVVKNTVTYVNGKYIYLTDGEKNLLFYGTNSQELKAGNVISGNVDEANLGGFWGNLKRYNKLPEFAFTEMNVKVEEEGTAPAPKVITVDALKDNINAYVQIKDAVFVSADNKNLTFTVGEQTLAVYNQFNVDVEALEAGATYTLTGMGCVYKKGDADAVFQLYLSEFKKKEIVVIPEHEVAGTKIAEYDFTKATSYPFYRLDAPATASYDVEDGALVINNTEALEQWWNVQAFVLDWFNVKEGNDYNIAIYMEATDDITYNINFGTWSASMPLYGINATAARGWSVSKIEKATISTSGNDAHILFQCGAFVGTVKIYKVELYEVEATGINNVKANAENAVRYNLAGQKVSNDYKGVVIENGKKVVLK